MQIDEIDTRRCSKCRLSNNPASCRVCTEEKLKPVIVNKVKYFYVNTVKKDSEFHGRYISLNKELGAYVLFHECLDTKIEQSMRSDYVSIWLAVKDRRTAVNAGF